MTATYGTTQFEWDGFDGKVKISTAEGSSVAMPAEDLLKFVSHAYVIPQRLAKAEQTSWREVLVG